MEFYIGDEGAPITIINGFSWATATVKQVKVVRPDDTSLTFTDTDVTVDDEDTGTVHILSSPELFTVEGLYLAQAYVEISAVKRYGPVITFMVYAVL